MSQCMQLPDPMMGAQIAGCEGFAEPQRCEPAFRHVHTTAAVRSLPQLLGNAMVLACMVCDMACSAEEDHALRQLSA